MSIWNLDDSFEAVVIDDTDNSTSDRDGLYRIHTRTGTVVWVAGASDYQAGDVLNAALESGMLGYADLDGARVETVRVGLRGFPRFPYEDPSVRRFSL